MAEKTVAELAPTLVCAFDEKELRDKLQVTPEPAKDEVESSLPPPQPKRIRQAVELLYLNPTATDQEVAEKVDGSLTPAIVQKIRTEMAAVKADPATKTSAEAAEAVKAAEAPVEPIEGGLEGPSK